MSFLKKRIEIMNKFTIAAVVSVGCSLCLSVANGAQPAAAAIFQYTANDFSPDGGVLEGFFSYSDNLSGDLTGSDLTDFTLSFSGSSSIPQFSTSTLFSSLPTPPPTFPALQFNTETRDLTFRTGDINVGTNQQLAFVFSSLSNFPDFSIATVDYTNGSVLTQARSNNVRVTQVPFPAMWPGLVSASCFFIWQKMKRKIASSRRDGNRVKIA